MAKRYEIHGADGSIWAQPQPGEEPGCAMTNEPLPKTIVRFRSRKVADGCAKRIEKKIDYWREHHPDVAKAEAVVLPLKIEEVDVV